LGSPVNLLRGASGEAPSQDVARMTSDGLVLHLERTLPASRDAVYRALTTPDELGKWWGPQGFTTPRVEIDARTGGAYRFAMQPPEGEPFHLEGEFREVDPPARLVYTFRWDPPDTDDRETTVTLSLEDRGKETGVRLTQGDFATEARYAFHEAGWSESFDRLEALLAESRP
jgi:uncharacterized protein YndB with AHSA1/START domain